MRGLGEVLGAVLKMFRSPTVAICFLAIAAAVLIGAFLVKRARRLRDVRHAQTAAVHRCPYPHGGHGHRGW